MEFFNLTHSFAKKCFIFLKQAWKVMPKPCAQRTHLTPTRREVWCAEPTEFYFSGGTLHPVVQAHFFQWKVCH